MRIGRRRSSSAHPGYATVAPKAKKDASAPSSGDAQTQEALAFTGRVMKEQGQLVLKDPVTKMSYQLDDQAKAKPFSASRLRSPASLR